jgi:bifunctional DNA-binding transcriptional regulator/antitoxin component of YhaV-PrlF toxin-antitoxin module
MITTVTSRGQTVVPARIRHFFKMKKNSRIDWVMEGNSIKVFPLPDDTIKAARGMFAGGAPLSEALLEERKKERNRK